ncbi:MAG: flagellar motor switch protein FliN [bacterium]|nr:flagellar motor switch protein FliN [bacterium]
MPGDDDFKEMDANNLGGNSEEDALSEQDVEQEEAAALEPEVAPSSETASADPVTVQPVQFASFEDLEQVQGPQNQNLNILLDVKLQLTVELGRTELPIKKVLELTKGSIVTLNKAAGEPVELYANGKLIAYGEVVVIEDNFGLRITHITDPAKRLNSLAPNKEET